MRNANAMKPKRLSKSRISLRTEANQLFEEALRQSRQVTADISALGRQLARLRDHDLWKNISDQKGVPRFRRWTEVSECLFGPMARRKCYELINSSSLTVGENAVSPEDVKKMGIKRAAELARLPPSQRSLEIISVAKTEPVMAVRNKVQRILNQGLPKDEQKPMLKLLAINLPEDIVADFEEIMEVGVYMDGIRDGDNTQTMRAKVFNCMLIAMREYYAAELSEALQRMRAEAGKDVSPAAEAQDWDDFPDQADDAAEMANNSATKAPKSNAATSVSRSRQLGLPIQS